MSDRGDPGFTFAGVMILAALGTFAWRSAPLESARQPSDLVPQYQTAEQGRIPARLWQDPLKAAQIFHQKQPDANHSEGGPSAQTLRADIERLAHQDSCDSQARLTVLSVMLSPSSYSEIEERRRRRRYAVLSGLGDSGFVPRDAETLGILRITEKRASLAADSGNDEGTGLPASSFDVPYEWYDYEDPVTGSPCRDAAVSRPGERSSVLVLWLDESRFSDQPFKRFKDLVASLLHDRISQKSNLKLQWKVLGPARSGTLRNFVANQCADSVGWLRNESRLDAFHILSPVATVSDLDLAKHRPKAGCDGAAKDGHNSDAGVLLGPYFTQSCEEQGKTCLRFLRTIRSDDMLISELKDELRERRGLKEQEHVVVLSEWDTYFGRFLPRAFAASGLADGGTRRAPEKADLKLLRYTYERGIDGFAAGVKPIDPEQPASNQDQILDQLYPTEGVAVRRPEGTGQFDYIRRLADIILARDRELRLSTGHGIRAVAIFGSDVYDKLLILRALRHRLPGAIWVTTDLDAHFLHPSEFPWTRNLVAASTFDLMPPRTIQPSSPPFRSSYQTAVYIATRMAVDMATLRQTTLLPVLQDGPSDAAPYPTQERMYEAIPPRLFEVGRHGFVPLGTAASVPAQGAFPVTAIAAGALHSPALAYFIGVGLIAVLALFALHQLRPRSGRPVLAIGVLIIAGVLLAVRAVLQGPEGEPISLADGVSIWPTEFIRLIAVFLAIVFISVGYRRLQTNARLLDHRYFCGSAVGTEETGLTIKEAITSLFSSVKRLRFRAWFIGTVLAAVLLVFGMGFIRYSIGPLTEKLIATGAVWSVIFGAWWLFINGKILSDVRIRSINLWFSQEETDKEQSAAELWTVYRENGALRHRVLRAFSYLLVYFAFAMVVFSLLGAASAPCRGEAACGVDSALLRVGVLLMLFLLFFVVDATRLCICWIEKLQNPSLKWDDAYRGELVKRLQFPPRHATYYLQIHLIGERTTEVSRLLYYPVVVILLMLLARSTYFDNWGFPQALAIIVGANFLIAIVAAARLNAAAQKARDNILEKLEHENLNLEAVRDGWSAEPTPSEIKELIEQLNRLRIGAFQRFWEQPIIRGSLLVLGGLGVTFIEYAPWVS